MRIAARSFPAVFSRRVATVRQCFSVLNAFDKVSLAMEGRVDGALDLPVSLGRDMAATATGGDAVKDRAGIVGPIRDDIPGRAMGRRAGH